jgi:hypothetical protein
LKHKFGDRWYSWKKEINRRKKEEKEGYQNVYYDVSFAHESKKIVDRKINKDE